MTLGVKGNFKKDPPIIGLNYCHANKWAIKTAGYTLITSMEVIYVIFFSLVAWLDKDKNPQHQILKETEEAHKPIYRVSLDQFSSFESY